MLIIIIIALIGSAICFFSDENKNQALDNRESNLVMAMHQVDEISLRYRVKAQKNDWEKDWQKNGEPAGRQGQLIEGIQIKLTGTNLPLKSEIEYRTHGQNTGWEKNWLKNGETAGVKDQQLDMIQIRIAGIIGYSVQYRVCDANMGWENTWVTNGESAGTQGVGLEAIEIKLVKNDLLESERLRTGVITTGTTPVKGQKINEGNGHQDQVKSSSNGNIVSDLPLIPKNVVDEPIAPIAPIAPEAPEDLAAKAGSQAITLSWHGTSEDESYKIYQSATKDGDYTEVAVGITETSYEVSDLEDGKRCYYKVKATSKDGDSPFSEVATAITSIDDQGNTLLGNQLLISNESTDFETNQPTGSLSLGSDKMEGFEQNHSDSFVDAIIPFEPVDKQEPINSVNAPNMRANAINEKGSTRDFYTFNFETEGYDLTNARLAYIGTYSEIWIETKTSDNMIMEITDDEAKELGEEFDQNIYPLVTENFYEESDINGDGRVVIMYYNIRQKWGWSEETISGYFKPADLYDTEFSNKMEMFYIDTLPTMGVGNSNPDFKPVYGLLAHEFQHLVNL